MDGRNLVCFFALVYVPSLCMAFGYTCYPDNTITVTGLGSSTTAVFAKNSDGVNCTTSAPADTVNITNCSMDKYIVFSFGSYDGMSANQIIGGSTITVVNITCNEIEPTGHTINNTFGASIQYNETQAIDVTYNFWSDLDKTSANVGEPVIWSIYFPSEYYLEVHYCTANPGTSYNADISIELISNYNLNVVVLTRVNDKHIIGKVVLEILTSILSQAEDIVFYAFRSVPQQRIAYFRSERYFNHLDDARKSPLMFTDVYTAGLLPKMRFSKKVRFKKM